LGVRLTTLPCKKENCREASKKFSRILRRRPRPKLGCGAKERKKEGRYFKLICVLTEECMKIAFNNTQLVPIIQTLSTLRIYKNPQCSP
jgi:hypothetical protein